MKKIFKTLCKLAAAIAAIGGTLYIARDQIKAVINKIKEVSSSDESIDDDFDEPFDDDDIFPEPSEDDRDYVSINITNEDTEDTAVSDADSDTVSKDDEAE